MQFSTNDGHGDRRVLRRVDVVLLAVVLVTMTFGTLMVYSASRARLVANGAPPLHFAERQALFIAVGLVLMVAVAITDYHRYAPYAPVLYAAMMLLLALVLTPLGSQVNGANGWFVIGSFQVQPAEYAKPVLVLMLAGVAAAGQGKVDLRHFLAVVGLVGLPLGLLVLQPDLGTCMVYAALMFAILLVAGAKARYLVALVLIGMIGIFGAFQLGFVRDYQKKRLVSFIDPKSDLKATGYNLAQSQTAIGSGGPLGKGLFKGAQTNGGYVPEQHTDFIFSAIGEELGFAGAVALIACFGLIAWRGIRAAQLARDFYGVLIAVGCTTLIVFQAFLNIAVTIGVMPVTGVTLPLVSYGGSSILSTSVLVGLLLNVSLRRGTVPSIV